MCASSGCRFLLGNEMPHTTCLSPAGYSTDFRDSVHLTAAITSQSATTPSPARLGHCRYSWPSFCSQAGMAVRPAPPVALQRLAFPVSGCLSRRSFHSALHADSTGAISAAIAPSRERPELAWTVRRKSAARRMSGSAASDRITPAVGAMPPSLLSW